MSARRLPSTSTPITPVSGISNFLATSTNLGIWSSSQRMVSTRVLPTRYYNGHPSVRIQGTLRHHSRPLTLKDDIRFLGIESRRRSFARGEHRTLKTV